MSPARCLVHTGEGEAPPGDAAVSDARFRRTARAFSADVRRLHTRAEIACAFVRAIRVTATTKVDIAIVWGVDESIVRRVCRGLSPLDPSRLVMLGARFVRVYESALRNPEPVQLSLFGEESSR